MGAQLDHPLRPLFAPRSIAIVGASPKGGYGLTTVENLRSLGFPGRIDIIHPRLAEVAGLPAVPRLADLDAVPDAIAVAVPASSVADVAAEAAALGVRAGVVYASGFAELGPAGVAQQRELVEACGTGLRIVGPNGLGAISFRDRSALWGIGMPVTHADTNGTVALAAQSGNMALTLMMSGRMPAMAYAVSAGNQAVVDVADCFDYFLADPGVRVVALIIEGLANPRRFRELALLAAERGVGVVVLKVGSSSMGERATIAHTGTLAGSDASYDALFAQTGVVRAGDLDELVAVCTLLAADHRLSGTGLGVFASSGGECGLIADIAEQTGVALPDLDDEVVVALSELVPAYGSVRNPFDLTAGGWGQFDVYAAATATLGRAAGVDIVGFVGDNSTVGGDPGDVGWREMTGGAGKAAAGLDVPVALITTTTDTSQQLVDMARADGLVLLSGLRPALRAISLVGDRRRFSAAPLEEVSDTAPAGAPAPELASLTGPVDETTAKGVLAGYGISVPVGRLVSDRAAAVTAADQLGYPVVMKVAVAGLSHKSDIGGVLLDLRDADAVGAGFDELRAKLDAAGASGELQVRVEQMVRSDGIEMIIGGHNDAVGSLVVVGAGGVLTELVADVGRLLWPFGETDVLRVLVGLRINTLLRGYRGAPAVDVGALATCAVAVGRLLADNPRISEIDVNPVTVTTGGATALDALIVIEAVNTSEG